LPTSVLLRSMPEDAATAQWRDAFAGCAQTLEALLRAPGEGERLAARAWWVACMGGRCTECQGLHAAWKAQAASALPKRLTPEHTETAVALPGWGPMAECVVNAGLQVGVSVHTTLDRVEAAGLDRQDAAAEWTRATSEVTGLRSQLQQKFLKGRLAPSMGEIGIDELRVIQVWMYGLASRLRECESRAVDFAAAAGMRDSNAPLLGYDEERWEPSSEQWRSMEACVHAEAARAGADCDSAWRKG